MASAFTKEMIAPCGLDCSLCGAAQKKENPCPGCRGDDANKPSFCTDLCGIVRCEKRKKNGYLYCDECVDFPCGDVMEKETRYTTAYPLRESPIENIRSIRTDGIEAFLARERANWTCSFCGGAVTVHTGTCSLCGRPHRQD